MKNAELRERVIAFNKRVKANREIVETLEAAGITVEAKPSAPPNRPGYSWIPQQLTVGGSIMWVESDYDSTAPGTAENPIEYTDGLTVYPNYYYTLDGVRKVWMGADHAQPEWENADFVKF